MSTAYELAIIIPTLNEAGNIELLLSKLEAELAGIAWEAIFVDDDSRDGTADLVREISTERPNVRCLQRIKRRGLSSACIEGMMSTAATYLAVMDADLQHDEKLLSGMLEKLKREKLDIVIGSRFAPGGDLGSFSAARERLSRIGNAVSRIVTKANLTDPLSGFFLLHRELLNQVVRSLSGTGFKILLDIFASADRPLRYAEVPLRFRERYRGESKLDIRVELEFMMLLADKTLGRLIPVRLIVFTIVVAFGMLVHLAVLSICHGTLAISFVESQAMATVAAICMAFYSKNQIAYRSERLRGIRFVRGFGAFLMACLVGSAINIQVAKSILEIGSPWLLAGALGSLVSSVWNTGVQIGAVAER